MTEEQKATLFFSLFKSKNIGLRENINLLLDQFGISDDHRELDSDNILDEYKNGLQNLNFNQFDNLTKMVLDKSFDKKELIGKLNFYEIENNYHQNIIRFLEGFRASHNAIDVHKIDAEFRGVQVATNDDFSEIIRLGYTGDWVIDPRNVKPLRIQIASMRETGSFSRGYFINADIEKMVPIDYEGKTRYRIYLSNPIVVNSGNRNIKFSNNPVRYIK